MSSHFRNRKRIFTTPDQNKRIKFLIKNGLSHERISKEIGLPIGVIKRFDKTKHFKIADNNVCIRCGYKPIEKEQILCTACSTRGDDSDLDFFAAETTQPSQIKKA